MTEKEVIEMFHKTEEELKNNPELYNKAMSEVETMRLEHPEFFDRMKDLTLGEMSRKDLKEMFDLLQSHVRNNRMAN
jgi:hypothetical protein